MNKLKLNWDELVVESFETAAQPQARGTVRGHLSAFKDTCLTETDELSCPGTCEPATCDGNCGGGGTGNCGTYEITCEPTGPADGTCCFYAC
jgi:hypothetical protein